MTNIVYIASYNPAGDGVTVDYVPMQNACTAAGVDGMVILEGGGKKYYMGTNELVIPKGVTIYNPGLAGGNNVYDQTWANSLGGILTDPSYPIFMQSRTALKNVTVYPAGMTFPQSDASAWTGTAISTNTGNQEWDIKLENSLIMGYAMGFDGHNCPRLEMEKAMIDCVAGVNIDTAVDCIRLHKVHVWPFATVSGPNAASGTGLVRNGTAYNFATNADGGSVESCFTNNHLNGFVVTDVNGLRFMACGAEAPYISNATGYLLQGNTQNTDIDSCQGVGCQNGVVINANNPGMVNSITGGMYGTNNDNNIRVFNGVAKITGVNFQPATNAHTSLIGTGSRIVATGNSYTGAIPFNILLNGAAGSQLSSSNNVPI